MAQIFMPKKVDEGNNNGGLGTLLGAAAGAALAPFTAGASIPAMMGLGASLGGAAGGMLSKPGSVQETPGIQQGQGQGGALARRLMESGPAMPPPQMQAQGDPGLEALKRRYGMLG
jgi:hypothetical protein